MAPNICHKCSSNKNLTAIFLLDKQLRDFHIELNFKSSKSVSI